MRGPGHFKHNLAMGTAAVAVARSETMLRGPTLGIPCKTAAGHAELAVRQRGLSQRHRTLLFIVDGKRTLDEVIELGARAGVPRAYIDELMALGLVVLAAPASLALETVTPAHEAAVTGWSHEPTQPAPLSRQTDSPQGLPLAAWRQAAHPQEAGDTVAFEEAVTNTQLAAVDAMDASVAEARALMMQALRAHAPVSGAVTMLRLRRARQRPALIGLFDEVHARLERHRDPVELQQLMERVARLLAS